MEIMKKLMIFMLSLAVLFSFAACDNSNANAPAGDDDQTVDTSTDYAYLAVTAGQTDSGKGSIASIIESIAKTYFKAGELMANGKISSVYAADNKPSNYSVDLAANSLKFEKRLLQSMVLASPMSWLL